MHITDERSGMILLACSEWQKANDPEKDDLFKALIELIRLGEVVAFHDEVSGEVRYQHTKHFNKV